MEESAIYIPDIHVGDMINAYLDDSKYSQADLARFLNMNPSNLSRLLKRPSMETKRLLEISTKVYHNFFAEFCSDQEHSKQGWYGLALSLNVGAEIEKKLVDLKMTRAEFANLIGIPKTDVARVLKKDSFETERLVKISRLLNYNFFKCFYDPVDDPIIPRFMHLSHLGLEEENKQFKQQISELKQRIVYLEDKLKAAGIDY